MRSSWSATGDVAFVGTSTELQTLADAEAGPPDVRRRLGRMVPLVLDTDIGTDCDDAVALAALAAAGPLGRDPRSGVPYLGLTRP